MEPGALSARVVGALQKLYAEWVLAGAHALGAWCYAQFFAAFVNRFLDLAVVLFISLVLALLVSGTLVFLARWARQIAWFFFFLALWAGLFVGVARVQFWA